MFTAVLIAAMVAEPHVAVVNGIVEITGVDSGAADVAKSCKLLVAGGSADEIAKRPAVAGTWSVKDGTIRFEPRFALAPGVKYLIVCEFTKRVELTVEIPKPPPGPPTSITAVYPSANRLPENTLRFYLHFSGQMTRGDIYRHLKLVRDDGHEVKQPFLELHEELWSTDGLRVTVLFHPGRVKRELVPREEDGPILEEGRTYTLIVSRDWKDAEGRPLVKEFRKTFSVGPPQEDAVDLGSWSLMAPRSGTDLPLIIRLSQPLDHALLHSTLTVVDATGQPVPGEITVGGGERVVTFVPAKPWKKGEYRLAADRRLEDMCGNRVGERFEVDVTRPDQKPRPELGERRFTVT
jgi:hypothetical protein